MENTYTSYLPPWWLKNRHLQTCLFSLFPPKSKQAVQWEQLTLLDGDFIDVCWAGPRRGKIAVLLHGLEGSVSSHYIQVMIDDLVESGWQVVAMHFRTCSGRLNRLPQSYHARHTQDLAYLLSLLRRRFPAREIAAIGFSLGANVLLNYLIDSQDFALVDKAIALSVPFEMNECAKNLSGFYQWQFLRTMKRKVKEKIMRGIDMPIKKDELKYIKTFYDFDDMVTSPLHGFRNSLDYYDRATVRGRLKHIDKKTLILHAADDPLVPSYAIPSANEISPMTNLVVTQHGGHLGFLTARAPWQLDYWWRQCMLDFLK